MYIYHLVLCNNFNAFNLYIIATTLLALQKRIIWDLRSFDIWCFKIFYFILLNMIWKQLDVGCTLFRYVWDENITTTLNSSRSFQKSWILGKVRRKYTAIQQFYLLILKVSIVSSKHFKRYWRILKCFWVIMPEW